MNGVCLDGFRWVQFFVLRVVLFFCTKLGGAPKASCGFKTKPFGE